MNLAAGIYFKYTASGGVSSTGFVRINGQVQILRDRDNLRGIGALSELRLRQPLGDRSDGQAYRSPSAASAERLVHRQQILRQDPVRKRRPRASRNRCAQGTTRRRDASANRDLLGQRFPWRNLDAGMRTLSDTRPHRWAEGVNG